MKLSKKNKYNLSDEEEDELDISGFGSFSGRDDFEDERLSGDEDDDDEGENKSMCCFIFARYYAFGFNEADIYLFFFFK